ncbi:MAG: endonuclease III, partial [Bacteroidetes bacterium]|nr:endonuclease III [Bacteroidota bacterium]
GVGRKTANVVASVAFDIPTMPVDTHVFRVAQRIGLVKTSKTPLQVEEQLLEIIPTEKLLDYHHWLILHGRYICQARKPKCEHCPVAPVCKYFKNKHI